MTAYCNEALFTTLARSMQIDVTTNDVPGLLERASRDLDAALGWPAPLTAGLRIDPTILTPFQQDCLAQACARQAIYRVSVDEDDVIVGPPRYLNAGPISFANTAPALLGPDAATMLAGAGLLRRTGVAAPPPDPPPLAA